MRALALLLCALFLCHCSGPDQGLADGGEVGDSGALGDVGGVGVGEGGSPGSGNTDAGAQDAGAQDAGAQDAGALDGGRVDAGLADSGTSDPGPPDAGLPDAGQISPVPTIAGCAIFPASSDWNRDISREPADQNSDHYLAAMHASSAFVHPDFGSTPSYGEPSLVVPGSEPRAAMKFLYAGQSEPGPYPYPQDVPIQQGPDLHAVVIDKDRCLLYETYDTHRDGNGGFSCGSGAIFNLTTGALRPDGWTSATASGLPLFPGLVRFDEAAELGEIRHALVYTSGTTSHFYVHPATHETGNSTDPLAPPMGLRLRLRANYDTSRFTGVSRVVVVALQRYGMLLIDNGSDFTIGGATDTRWPDPNLEQLKSLPGSAFEAVRVGTLHQGP